MWIPGWDLSGGTTIVDTPNDEFSLLSYTNGSPLNKLCPPLIMILFSLISTPPPTVDCLASKDISLTLLVTIGLRIAPDPPPPVRVIDNTFSISKFCWSTKTSCSDPVITGCTSAVTPDPTWGITTFGRFITS